MTWALLQPSPFSPGWGGGAGSEVPEGIQLQPLSAASVPKGTAGTSLPLQRGASTAAGASSRSSPSVPEPAPRGPWGVGALESRAHAVWPQVPAPFASLLPPLLPRRTEEGSAESMGGPGGILSLLSFGPTGPTLCGPQRWGRKGAGPCSGTRSVWGQFLGLWCGHLHGLVPTVLMLQHPEVDTHSCPLRRAACQPPSPENLVESLVFLLLP